MSPQPILQEHTRSPPLDTPWPRTALRMRRPNFYTGPEAFLICTPRPLPQPHSRVVAPELSPALDEHFPSAWDPLAQFWAGSFSSFRLQLEVPSFLPALLFLLLGPFISLHNPPPALPTHISLLCNHSVFERGLSLLLECLLLDPKCLTQHLDFSGRRRHVGTSDAKLLNPHDTLDSRCQRSAFPHL